MKLSSIQKLVILVIILLAIVLAAVFFVLDANKKSKIPTTNTAPTTNQVPVATTPSPEISKNYNQVVKDIGAKVTAGTTTSADFIDLGIAYYNLGNLTKSLEAYNQAIAKDPANANAYGNIGNIYRDQSEFAKAEQSYKKAIQLDPKTSKFYIGLAFLYNGLMEDKQSAINILNQGLVAIPSDADIIALLEDYSK
jgi:tetratricopeptide (TPR) repeat protein